MRLLVDCDQHLGETQEQLILLQKLEENYDSLGV